MDVILPVITLIVGYLGTLFTEGLRDARNERRAREARQGDFQRETIIELQEVLQRLGRATGAAHHHDFMENRRAGVWGRSQLPEDVNQADFDSRVRAIALNSRVSDDQLRALVQQYLAVQGKLAFAKSEAESDVLMAESLERFELAISRAGELIRSM